MPELRAHLREQVNPCTAPESLCRFEEQKVFTLRGGFHDCSCSYPRTPEPQLRVQRQALTNLALPENELMVTTADIEAKSRSGSPFIKTMMDATGLSKDQIRHRHGKDLYKQYLKRARASVRVEARKLRETATTIHPLAISSLQQRTTHRGDCVNIIILDKH